MNPRLLLAACAWATMAALTTTAMATTTAKAVLLVPAADERLSRQRLERAALGHPTGAARDAVQLALADARLELEAAGVKMVLDVQEVDTPAAVQDSTRQAARSGAVAVLTDLPAALTLAAADAAPLPVINLGAADDRLREDDCRRNLWHTAASERMKADALAQTLVARKWTQVLLLSGPSAVDAARAATAQAAIKRYGLKLAGSRSFRLSADPRERDQANPLLLTGPAAGSYDVVWVVDSDGEFAQTLPYRTGLPRPVVGDAGLVPLAWSARFERYGAPQASRRLAKAAGRRMEAHDWQAWMAGKALVAAVLAAPRATAAQTQAQVQALVQALSRVELDGSKGMPLTFREWDGQLRQPILLADGQAVISQAPVEGVLHPRNALDTLGADAPEKRCRVTR